jgi:hypothetical protein
MYATGVDEGAPGLVEVVAERFEYPFSDAFRTDEPDASVGE